MPFDQSGQVLELLDERARLLAEAGGIKGRITQVEKRIVEAVKPALDAAYQREGQAGGTVKFVYGNHTFKAVVDRRVEWNSDALKEIAAGMSPVDAATFFKITYSVADAMFKAILNPELKAKLTVARLVKYSEPKISLADAD